MPEATPFTALGVGNGFPFCPIELAVRPVDGSLGMTIAAYNAAYATFNGGDFVGLSDGTGFSQPFTTLTDSMNFFWNLHSFTLSSNYSWVRGSNSDSASVTSILISKNVEKTPQNRTCHRPIPFVDSDPNANVSLFFTDIYYYGDGENREYYWGLVSTYINPRIGSGMTILPRTYENRNSNHLNEYTPFVLVFDDVISIAMACYTGEDYLDWASGSASIDEMIYYTYPLPPNLP